MSLGAPWLWRLPDRLSPWRSPSCPPVLVGLAAASLGRSGQAGTSRLTGWTRGSIILPARPACPMAHPTFAPVARVAGSGPGERHILATSRRDRRGLLRVFRLDRRPQDSQPALPRELLSPRAWVSWCRVGCASLLLVGPEAKLACGFLSGGDSTFHRTGWFCVHLILSALAKRFHTCVFLFGSLP